MSSPAFFTSSTPSSDRAQSYHPVNLFAIFHSDSLHCIRIVERSQSYKMQIGFEVITLYSTAVIFNLPMANQDKCVWTLCCTMVQNHWYEQENRNLHKTCNASNTTSKFLIIDHLHTFLLFEFVKDMYSFETTINS